MFAGGEDTNAGFQINTNYKYLKAVNTEAFISSAHPHPAASYIQDHENLIIKGEKNGRGKT